MARVAIIGAGIIGLATAYELTRRGSSVVLIDPRVPGSAASSGNTGWIVPALSGPVPAPGLPSQVARWSLRYDSPFRVDLRRVPGLAPWLLQFWRACNLNSYRRGLDALGSLNRKAYGSVQRWLDSGLEFEHDRQGVLFAASDAQLIDHLVTDMDALAPYGFQPVDWVTHPVLGDLEPSLSPDLASGILAHGELHVRPESLINALLNALDRASAEFVTASVNRQVEVSRDRVVRIRAGRHRIDADHVVIAAGAWTGDVGQRFGVQLPVIAGKGYSITVSDPTLTLQQPLYLADAKIACTPFEGENRFAGMMELTGTDDSLDPRRLAAMSVALDRYLPGWSNGERRSAWAGLRPMTPDGLPLIGKAPGLANVYVASGHGMLGMTMAAVTAEVIADLIDTGTTNFDVAPFDPARF